MQVVCGIKLFLERFHAVAIMVTAWYGELPAAVFATALSVFMIDFYFVPPLYSVNLKPADLMTLGFFGLEALTMAYCIDYLRKHETYLRQANLDLEQQVVEKHHELSDKKEKFHGLMYELAVTEDRERRHLAAELHDYLAQLLTLARMKVKQAQQHSHHSSPEVNHFIVETDDLLRKSVDYVRTLMAELYPTQLHELGLPAGLRWLAGQMPRHGLAVDLSMNSESLPMTSDTSLLLYQCVRELLMNIVKHAGVSCAAVSLDVTSELVSIRVEDRGRGFDPLIVPRTVAGHHFGLQNVRERITAIGGSFVVESAIGKGTNITLTTPLQVSSASELLRAARSSPRDRVVAKPAGHKNQASLPL